MEILSAAIDGFNAQSKLEWLAMLLGFAYLLFIIRENLLAWPCAFISTAIYIIVFWDAALLMESALNVYYLIMAAYGFWHWSKRQHHTHSDIPIVRWPLRWHLGAITGIVSISAFSGYFLSENSHAVWPYVDSFTTWASVFTTYLVARKVFENWYYWLVIDATSIVLYLERGLYPTVILMSVYLIMICFGLFSWQKQWAKQVRMQDALS